MAEYDLVIIGGSLEGRYAAVRAIHQGAKKVALVEPLATQTTPLFDVLAPHAVNRLKALDSQQFLLPGEYPVSIGITEVSQWAKNAIANIDEQNSLATLSALGVDVIASNGGFTNQKPLAFSADNRQLLAKAYLIATGSQPTIPDIEGLQNTDYLTVKTIWQRLAANSAKDWVIIGGNPDSVMLAQTLTKLGFNITLIVKRPRIVAGLDSDIAQLLQAILEAEGVRVLTDTPVTQIKQIDRQKWIQAGDRAIEADEVIICVGYQPNVADLNLELVEVKWHRRGIVVNPQLQTTNPHIYAGGDVIGGYRFANIANYEAKVAVNNALSLPRLKVNYHSIPWAIFSQPPVAQVGLTQTKAKQFYSDVLVLQQHFKTIAAAHLQAKTTGTCTLVVRRNGEILGATIVGSHSIELINVISLAIAQKIKLNAVAQFAPIYPSFSEVFAQIASDRLLST
ncbi:dihydrolipoyl dehydrogenase family protein [Aliterella atlantica]|uniref:dihydrolipoyl dehydrogenase family protein n=1 Tax=Aliterella atlantica TaxID=1827278 RepID=UPI0005D4533E|nr:NAD(P)/FAD-dependent oxidoreductase [Aliterella atlantica]